jgi:hypothetical protein
MLLATDYGRAQPAGYQVVTGSSPNTTEDAALVHLGGAWVDPDPDGTETARSTAIATSPSFTAS